jgi:hypothetical protein
MLAELQEHASAGPLHPTRRRSKQTPRNPEHIYAVIGGHFGVSRLDLLSPRRDVKIVRARQWGMFLAKTEWSELSFPDVGRMFDRDHTTVVHGVRKITEELETSPSAYTRLVDLVMALRRMEASCRADARECRSNRRKIQCGQGGHRADGAVYLSNADMIARLRRAITSAGGQSRWAADHGFSDSFVSMCMSGDRTISRNVAEVLGFEPVVVFAPLEGAR